MPGNVFFPGLLESLTPSGNARSLARNLSGFLKRKPEHWVMWNSSYRERYPDVIESVSVKGPAAIIKSHHNVGGLPPDLKFKLIEPLRELFKDEVRIVGRELGLEKALVDRQPFPGPGLAVRIVGEVTPERLRMVREADAIVQHEVREHGYYDRLWQSFAVLLPVSSVGVMGDARTYASTIAVRAVESEDGMTADWAKLPAPLLERISTRIVNEVKGVNRVVFDITSKPPGTIEWE